jgi:cysteinyl-tRNA synthetase
MVEINLSNSLTRKKEKFVPNEEGKVFIYSCGPTVYWNQHIGHMYAYVQWDVLVRFLRFAGNDVRWVMNVTDVGHMTSDEDEGEDKMEKGAKREGLTVWQIADKYIEQFKDSMNLLGIEAPDVLCRATENIPEQIELAKKIEENGFAYRTKKGLVFDTSKFPEYSKFGNLNLKEMKSRDDVEIDPEKRNPWDFFLWAVNPKHVMKWESPWGEGYPGWHIECTAMSVKYLGRENFDIHTGGIEHVAVHHTNEIAQGYAAFGKQTANYWLHNSHLLGEGGVKMSKSLGNFVTAQELVEKGYDPIALRYLFLNSHYKKGMSFSYESLDSAQTALKNLRERVRELKGSKERTVLSEEKENKTEEFMESFHSALADDLNTPQALAVMWEALKSSIPSMDKYELVREFDKVLGLELEKSDDFMEPAEITKLRKERDNFRNDKKFDEADAVRKKIEEMGYEVLDTPEGTKVKPIK